MSERVISIEGIGKAYRIGLAAERHDTLRDAIMGVVKAPFVRFQRLGEARTERDTFWALRNISFEVNRGDVVGIIGRNGAGKSTLLKVLSRITEPTEGRVRLKGRVAALLEVGTGFHPELTGRENIFLNGAILGMRKAEIARKFDEIVAFAEVEEFLDTPVKRYSSGMRVRLAFGVAAHLEPEILIVDEVLAVGDSEFQRKCLGKMEEVSSGQGRTVLFVSHNMAAVRRLCKWSVHLEHGTVRGIGETEDIVDQYLEGPEQNIYEINLRDRRRAASDMIPTLTNFSFEPEDGYEKIATGCSVVFEINYESERAIPDATLNINIDALGGGRVMSVNTRLEKGLLTLPAGQRTARCHVKDLPLVPGHYTINLSLWSGTHLRDHMEKAAKLEVQYADYFGTGEMPNKNQAKVVKRSEWEL